MNEEVEEEMTASRIMCNCGSGAFNLVVPTGEDISGTIVQCHNCGSVMVGLFVLANEGESQ